MACKHAELPGTDPCIRYPSGQCKEYSRRYNSTHYERHGEQSRKQARRYARENVVCRSGSGTPANRGQASEHLVAADLLSRGLAVTKPLNVNGAHDLHAKCGDQWFTFQVKTGQLNLKTGLLKPCRSVSDVTSDIVAVADLTDKRIRYIPQNVFELPEELCAAF